jgi:hypothetical protein
MRRLPQPLQPCCLAPIEPPLCRPANFTGVLQLRDAGAGAVFVLLTGATADATGALEQPALHSGN